MTVAFKAHKNGTNQSFTVNVLTQVTFGTEAYDLGSYFTSDAWTPPAGYVSMVINLAFSGTIANGTTCRAYLYKNGTEYSHAYQYAMGNSALYSFAFDDQANSSDIYTVYGFVGSGSGLIFLGNPEYTNFSGVWLGA